MNIARVGIGNRSVATLPTANQPAGLGEPGPKPTLKMPKFTGGSQPVDPLHHVPDDVWPSILNAALAKLEPLASPNLVERARQAAITKAEASVSF